MVCPVWHLIAGNSQDSDRNLSPPAERPPSSTAAPSADTMGLKIIAVSRGKPVFPTSVLMERFEAGSPEYDEVQKLKEVFEAEFGVETANQSSSTAPTRANAPCDFSVDEGLRPLDTGRTVELRCLPLSQLSDERLALHVCFCLALSFSLHHLLIKLFSRGLLSSILSPRLNPIRRLGVCAGRNGKPTMILDKNFHLWLTNPTADSMEISAGELFGFGTGQYQNVVVQRSFGRILLPFISPLKIPLVCTEKFSALHKE